MRTHAALAAMAALAVALMAAGLRASLLFETSLAHGYDGWYYVLQVRSWLEGAPLFSDRSLVFPVLAGLGALTGDVILGNKLAACGFAGLTAAAGVAAGWRSTGAVWAGVACGLWWGLSPLHLGVSAEFLKNAGGLAVLGGLLAVLPGCERSRKMLALAVGLALLGPLVHKLSGALGLGVAGGYAGLRVLQRWRGQGAAIPTPRWLPAAIGLAALVVLAVGVLRPSDLTRLLGGLDPNTSRWGALTGGRLVLGEQLELAAVHLAPLGFALALLRSRVDRSFTLALLPMAMLCAAPGLGFSWDGLAWRLMLVGFMPLGLLVAQGVARSGPAGPWLCAGLLALGLLQAPVSVEAQQERSPDYENWAPALATLQAQVPEGHRVVAHRGLCGFIWAQSGIVCENFQPQGDLETWWRVAFSFSVDRLSPYTLTHPPIALRPAYTLVHETDWRRFTDAEGARFSLTRDPRNPYRPRPGFVYGPGAVPDSTPPP